MTNFTPWDALLGGTILGLSALLFLLIKAVLQEFPLSLVVLLNPYQANRNGVGPLLLALF